MSDRDDAEVIRDVGALGDTSADPDRRETAAEQIFQDGTLVLIGCGAAKRDPEDPTDVNLAEVGPDEKLAPNWSDEKGPAWRAEDLYTSTYFGVKRELAETVTQWDGDPDTTPWAILSAEHDLLWPWEVVKPYDKTIGDLGDDPTVEEDRVHNALGLRRPDGQEIVSEMDQWATMVAYGLSRWLSMHREKKAMPYTSEASTLLVLAGQDYIEPLRERGVFEFGASRMMGDVNDAYELPVDVRSLFEEIDAGGIGEQMGWMSEAIEALGGPADRSEQATLAGGEQA